MLCVVSIKNLKILKYHAFLKVLSVISSKCKNEDETLFKEGESIEILKIICSIKNT